MKLSKHQLLTALLILLSRSGQAQGTFQNLDFEQANIVFDPSFLGHPNVVVYASEAIPAWTPSSTLGTNDVLYNTATAGSPSVSILDANGTPPALDGRFSIYLYGGIAPSLAASISQTALVPVAAESILFEAQHFGPAGGTLLVSLGGQNISFSPISSGPNYTLYGGNIPAFGGQSEQLIFSALSGTRDNFWNIDDIQFSDTSVPEPSAFGLLSLSAVLFFGWRMVRRTP
jgi:hypothetical protein